MPTKISDFEYQLLILKLSPSKVPTVTTIITPINMSIGNSQKNEDNPNI